MTASRNCVRNAKKFSALLGTASFLTIASAVGANAQETGPIEEVLVTGSLIRGAAAIGVPVTTLTNADFQKTGALTTADLLKSVPSIAVQESLTVTNTGGATDGLQQVSIHNIGGYGSHAASLLLIDGVRIPAQGHGNCVLDPSIIPAIAVERIDVLADGASATYGSDAVAGVINVVLKRGFDGAISQLRAGESTDIGGLSEQATQLFGKTWDSGDITLSYEFYHLSKIQGPARDYFTYDFSQYGYDDRTPLFSARPGIVSVGKATGPAGTPNGFDPTLGTTCNNCFSIPKGTGWNYGDTPAHTNPTAAGSAPTATWSAVLANPGVGNEFNPYDDAWILPEVQRNAEVFTFDQEITTGVEIFAQGFYNSRRGVVHSAGTTGAVNTNSFLASVPTTNPYYPSGAPAGLMVDYNIDKELQGYLDSGGVTGRYGFGFNVDLPDNWKGKIFYDKTEDHNFVTYHNGINKNLVSAALGNTVKSVAAVGTTPGIAAYTKPANVPYLNLFCDSNVFACNSPITLSYIGATRNTQEREMLGESGVNFDGPVLDLPAGPLRAAVGADYIDDSWNFYKTNGYSSDFGDGDTSLDVETGRQTVWAVFAQMNVPLVSEVMGIPLIESFDIEVSGRIDHYSAAGTTKNPKLSFNWKVASGLTLRGSGGTSFRAPSFEELSNVTQIKPINSLGGGAGTNNTDATCTDAQVAAHAHPTPGSAAAILNPNCDAALQYLGGIVMSSGGSGVQSAIYPNFHLSPEKATNWSLGFEYAPTNFLKGFDLDFTYYHIKIKDRITGLNPAGGLGDPLGRPYFILNTDPKFSTYVANLLTNPFADGAIIGSNVSFIEDGADTNVGFSTYAGIDFGASYDWDMGDWGAWHTRITGTYLQTRLTNNITGGPVFDGFKGLNSGGRMNYRTELGWEEGENKPWSITAYMNYHPHTGSAEVDQDSTTEILPPSCFLIGNTPCNASGAPQFAQYTNQYPVLTLFEPAYITFDLSVGYQTGDMPANGYLKNIGVQFTATNVTDRRPLFAYLISTTGGSPDAFNRTNGNPLQRVVTLVVTKAW